MHAGWKWLLALLAVLVLVVLGTGAFLLGRAGAWVWPNSGRGIGGFPGMCGMGGGFGAAGCGPFSPAGGQGQSPLGLEQAREAVESYLSARGFADLEVHEVMEFERNFYAIVEEKSTGMGAFELLIDRFTGLVRPEPGPNMMWNARYGMMMGWRFRSGTPARITAEDAVRIAQNWLDRNLPGVEARSDDVDAFYGYYTLHVWKDGQIFGMLSVHGQTGQVWYHTWHGDFVRMLEAEEGSS